jgi:hypothetical protein
MQVQLDPHTVSLLQRASEMLNVATFDEVIVKAISQTLEQTTGNTGNGSATAQDLVHRFERFRGVLRGTIEEVVDMRHEGLR